MELPYQTYERITGKKWTGGQSPEVQDLYKQYGITAPAASAEANLALQKALLGQPSQTSTQQEKPISAPYAPSTFVNKSDNTGPVNLLDNLPKSQTAIDLNKIYEDAFKTAGLDTLKTKFSDLQTQIDEKRKQLNKAIGTVNENPWYSEASRVGHVRRLQELAQPDIDNLINQQKAVKDLFNEGVTQAKDVANRTLQQSEFNRQSKVNLNAEQDKQRDDARAQINAILTQLNNGTLDLASLNQNVLTQLEKTAGYPTGFLANVSKKPQKQYQSIFTKENDAGDVTTIGITPDGKQVVIGTIKGIGTKSSSGGSGAIKNDIGEQYKTRLDEEIDKVYKGYYGTQGAREVALNILQNEFKDIDVAKDIYNRIPNNWENMRSKIAAQDDFDSFINNSIKDSIENTAINY